MARGIDEPIVAQIVSAVTNGERIVFAEFYRYIDIESAPR